MADKYQGLVAGREKMVEGLVTSAGVADAGKIVAAGADGRLDESLMPLGIAADVKVAIASEALSAGDYVNIYDDVGTSKCRLADASNDRPAHGFVKAAVAPAASATIYFEGSNSSLTGLTAGVLYYLGTAGNATATAPVLPGSVIHQLLGVGIDATSINTDIQSEIVL